MIYWLINYLNYNGYYFNESGFLYYANTEYYYNDQQSRVSRSQRRRMNECIKNKLAANSSNKNVLQEAKNLRKAQDAYGNSTAVTKMLVGAPDIQHNGAVEANLQSLGEVHLSRSQRKRRNRRARKELASNSNKNVLQDAENSINCQELEQISLNEKVPSYKTVADNLQTGSFIKSKTNKFSVDSPNTPEFLQSIAEAYYLEISLMQSRLIAESSLSPIHDDNDLMVAKIHIENKPKISDDFFEFIRTELVGWIGVYQQQGMGTPIFHNITKYDSYLTIVCDNKYAYECVERCLEDLAQTETIGPLKMLALPPITQIIYCFDAKYEGIARDSDLFLSQLHLHKPKLYSKDWLVASHQVCLEECRTYFIFLIDERSALALNFYYNQSFYVCMQQVTFRNRGIIAKSIQNFP